ncbi:MAG: MATE family efflux transporter [Prevotella sp.]|nr:MATE family efflux transporter [Prevotella sp.]MBQ6188123.1 MATE family efflux transporter [Prevotella sp.]
MVRTDNGQKRNSLIRKNVFYSFLTKGWAGVVQLLMVPLTIFCLGDYENGVWLTVNSFLIWTESLDIGLGNGLRNRLAVYWANGDMEKARQSVSSTFFTLMFIMLPIAVVLLILINTLDIYHILNVSPAIVENLRAVYTVSLILVCAHFVIKFIGNVYLGMQLPAVNNALVVGGQTLALVIIFVLSRLKPLDNMLMWVAVANTLSPLLIYLAAYPITFYKKFPELRPSIRYFKTAMVGELFGLGFQFFLLQMAGIIIFASSNAIISRIVSPAMVTPYQVAYRYFSLTMMIFTVIGVPFWTATTDAYERCDMRWISQSMRRMNYILLGFVAMLTLMVVVSKPVYHIWVGSGIEIPILLSIGMALYMMIIITSLCYSYFLNGFGYLRVQLIMTLTSAAVYIPLSVAMGRSFGVVGVIFALCIVNIPGAIVNRIQFNKLIRGKAKGIWKK